MLSLLHRNPNYRRLWLAQAGSEIGTWFHTVASAHTILLLTGSASSVGWMLLCALLPNVVFGPLLSPWVGRLPKRPLLYVSDLLRAFFALSFVLAYLWQIPSVLYLGAFLSSLAGILFIPARKAAIPLIVSQDELAEVNAFESGTSGMLSVIGAATGGILTAVLSPVAGFVINALSFLWSAWCIWRTRWQEDTVAASERVPYLQSLGEGFAELSRNRMARMIIVIGISWGFAGGGYYILIRTLSDTVYGMGALGLGLLYAVDGLGVITGAFLVGRFVGSRHSRSVLWYGTAYLTQAVFFALLTQVSSFAIGASLLFLMRMSSGIIIPLDSYLLQTCTEPHIRGRVFTLHSSTYGGVMGISFLLAGAAFEQWGVPPVGMVIGAVSLGCGLAWLFQFSIRERRTAACGSDLKRSNR